MAYPLYSGWYLHNTHSGPQAGARWGRGGGALGPRAWCARGGRFPASAGRPLRGRQASAQRRPSAVTRGHPAIGLPDRHGVAFSVVGLAGTRGRLRGPRRRAPVWGPGHSGARRRRGEAEAGLGPSPGRPSEKPPGLHGSSAHGLAVAKTLRGGARGSHEGHARSPVDAVEQRPKTPAKAALQGNRQARSSALLASLAGRSPACSPGPAAPPPRAS